MSVLLISAADAAIFRSNTCELHLDLRRYLGTKIAIADKLSRVADHLLPDFMEAAHIDISSLWIRFIANEQFKGVQPARGIGIFLVDQRDRQAYRVICWEAQSDRLAHPCAHCGFWRLFSMDLMLGPQAAFCRWSCKAQ